MGEKEPYFSNLPILLLPAFYTSTQPFRPILQARAVDLKHGNRCMEPLSCQNLGPIIATSGRARRWNVFLSLFTGLMFYNGKTYISLQRAQL